MNPKKRSLNFKLFFDFVPEMQEQFPSCQESDQIFQAEDLEYQYREVLNTEDRQQTHVIQLNNMLLKVKKLSRDLNNYSCPLYVS